MVGPQQNGIVLPSLDAVRNRIKQITTEASALRRFLRAVHRVAPQLATLPPNDSAKQTEVMSHASR